MARSLAAQDLSLNSSFRQIEINFLAITSIYNIICNVLSLLFTIACHLHKGRATVCDMNKFFLHGSIFIYDPLIRGLFLTDILPISIPCCGNEKVLGLID